MISWRGGPGRMYRRSGQEGRQLDGNLPNHLNWASRLKQCFYFVRAKNGVFELEIANARYLPSPNLPVTASDKVLQINQEFSVKVTRVGRAVFPRQTRQF